MATFVVMIDHRWEKAAAMTLFRFQAHVTVFEVDKKTNDLENCSVIYRKHNHKVTPNAAGLAW